MAKYVCAVAFVASVFVPAVSAWAQNAPDGARLFQARCAACHGDDARLPAGAHTPPPLSEWRKRSVPASFVLNMIGEGGIMAAYAKGWSAAERQLVAEWVAGAPLATGDPLVPSQGKCGSAPQALSVPFKPPYWNGWGVDMTNGRLQPAEHARLKASAIPKLTLKWAFGFPNGTVTNAQPTVVGGRLYVGSENGTIYSLDAKTGCFYWTFKADAWVRTAPVVGASKAAPSGTLVYVGDYRANVYAIDAHTGALVWRQRVDAHPQTRITGAPTLVDGRLYVPISGIAQEGTPNNPALPCCDIRGSVVSVDAHTGRVIWQAYTIAETPAVYGKTEKGAARMGPSGASVWVSPTVDLKRRAVYVGTGNAFTPPVADTTDAVLAFGLDDGRLLWKRQLTAGDVTGAPNAPDVDIGASVILRRMRNGSDVLLVGQKSGDVYALDPANGQIRWHVKASQGGWWGGIQWGMAADNRNLYVPVSDIPYPTDPLRKGEKVPSQEAGRLIALRLEDGKEVWMQSGISRCPGAPAVNCHPAKSAAITVTPDAVFAGSMDGYLRAHATKDGRVLWEFNTARDFTTVNGVKAKGGTINGPGPVVVDGMVFVASGYFRPWGLQAGNVLLAFSAE